MSKKKGVLLNARQRMFVKEYLKDLNGTQAAIRAGYSVKSAQSIATENMRKPFIADEIKKGLLKREVKLELNAEWVLRNLKAVSDRCLQEVTPIVERINGEAVETGEFKFDSSGVCKANELIGKHLKMFTEKHEVTGADGDPLKVEHGIIILPAKV